MNETDQLEFSLKNINNYKNSIENPIHDIVNIYTKLVIEYTKFSFETVKIKEHLYFKYILLRGLNTITRIFTILLYHTKNMNLSYYHCQKSYYYYIEFISQITNSQHSFLQLNSKDAIMYVYKQTLFEINNDFNKKKDNDADNDKLIRVNSYIHLLNIFIEYTIQSDIRCYKNDFINKLEKLANKINLISFCNLHSFVVILDILLCKQISIDNCFEITTLLIKKNKFLPPNFDKKIQDTNFDVYLSKSSDIFVNWLLDS